MAMDRNFGFRFRPSDEELLVILAYFVAGKSLLSPVPVEEKNLYDEEPWMIFNSRSKDTTQYFYTRLEKNSPDKLRFRRRIGSGKGTWKAQDKGKEVYKSSNGKLIGYKRSLRYENNGSQENGRWLMKEYYLPANVKNFKPSSKDTVLCAIKRKCDCNVHIALSSSKVAQNIEDIIGESSTETTAGNELIIYDNNNNSENYYYDYNDNPTAEKSEYKSEVYNPTVGETSSKIMKYDRGSDERTCLQLLKS